MVYIKRVWEWIKTPYTKYKQRKELQKRLDEMKKRDPFIYK